MNVLVFTEGDLRLAKGWHPSHFILTARQDGAGDIRYDPEEDTYEDITSRLPCGFGLDAVLIASLEYGNFVWGLHEAPVPIVATVSDTNICFETVKSTIPFVDLFICNERLQADRLERTGAKVVHLPWFALDAEVFRPGDVTETWDLLFVGNLQPYIHKRRGKLLERLLSALGKFDCRVLTNTYGPGYLKALARAKMVFNHSVRGEINMRVYEALGARKLLLVEETNSEILERFTAGEHVATYSEENLIEQVDYFLSHDREREEIAQRGYEEVVRNHSWEARAQSLGSILEGVVSSGVQRAAHDLSEETLHRLASRIFMNHRRFNAAIRHAESALSTENSSANRENLSRVLCSAAAFVDSENREAHLRYTERATDAALESERRNVFTAFNTLELDQVRGTPDGPGIARFIDALVDDEYDHLEEGGPLNVDFEYFRVNWETQLNHESDVGLEPDRRRNILLARAHELLGDWERGRGNHSSAVEAYSEAVSRQDWGYLRHKLGSTLVRLGRLEDAEPEFRAAVGAEPFFFAAQCDLACVCLETQKLEEAKSVAADGLLTIAGPFDSFETRLVEILERCAIPEHLCTYQGHEPIHWEGVFFNLSAHALEARELACELERRSAPLSLSSHDVEEEAMLDVDGTFSLLKGLEGEPDSESFVHVFHGSPAAFEPRSRASVSVVRTTFETDRLPKGWAEVLQEADRVWVLSEFNRRVFEEQGVPEDRIAVIPPPLGPVPLPTATPLEILNTKRFNFLSVFDWGARKGWDILLRAFFTEFSAVDDVTLVLRICSLQGLKQVEVRDRIRGFIRSEIGQDPDRGPELSFVDETLRPGEMRGLYAAVDAFVLPTRGEGFGRPLLEAIVAGLPTIGTKWGGQLDFLNDRSGYLIDVEGLERIEGRVPEFFVGHKWAVPSVDHLRVLMRRVYEDPEEGRRRARSSIPALLERYNVKQVANLVVDDLNRLTA